MTRGGLPVRPEISRDQDNTGNAAIVGDDEAFSFDFPQLNVHRHVRAKDPDPVEPKHMHHGSIEKRLWPTKLPPYPSAPKTSFHGRLVQRVPFLGRAFIIAFAIVAVMYRTSLLAAVAGLAYGQSTDRQGMSADYYQLTPEILPGPTPTGEAAFLAATNPAPFSGVSYIPNSPLETQVPIMGNTENGNIFHMHGQLSHYFPNPDGFGVDEYPLPGNASIVQVNMLSRHGSRYPTTGAGATVLAQKIANFTSGVNGSGFAAGPRTATGPLSFLNTWTFKLGAEILVPVGKQEMFESGTLHQIMYGHLFANNGTKLIARTTTQDRMLKSAEYFLAGFFGLGWEQNSTLVIAIENTTGIWNNTLAGYYNCNNSNTGVSRGGNNATTQWASIYLADAVKRLNGYAPAFNWTITDAYNAQSLCAYETVALGYSAFCDLFTYTEWEGYEYSVDINFAGNNMFQSPTGRAVGVGYVYEILNRLQHHVIREPAAQINVTLDNNTATFPLDQTLNFDFSHDTNIASILTAFGLTQFATFLPPTGIVQNRSLVVSHMEPFGARLDMEIIQTPKPLDGNRKNGAKYATNGTTTRYIHFILNQRTIPLGRSFPQCGNRDDGWCELTTFMEIQSTKLQEAQYDYSCNGKYAAVPYGTLNNGVPQAMNASIPVSSSSAGATGTQGSPKTGTATQTSSSAAATASCSPNGALICNGPLQFGLCNFGKVVFQNVALGTNCQGGKIVGTGIYAQTLATATSSK